MELSIFSLPQTILNDYLYMTYPYYKQLYETDSYFRKRIIAVGACMGFTPIGLALGTIDENTKYAKILSLYVDEVYRNKGIGASLLNTLVDKLKTFNPSRIEASYCTNNSCLAFLERIFNRSKWVEDLTQSMLLARWSCDFQEYPFKISPQLLPNDSITLFTDISEEEKNWFLKNKVAYPSSFDPYKNQEFPIEPQMSLVYRQNNEIKGWLIIHQIDVDTIRYTNLYVLKEKRNARIGGLLLWEALQKQYQRRHVYPYGTCGTATSNRIMVRFLMRHDRADKHRSKTLYKV